MEKVIKERLIELTGGGGARELGESGGRAPGSSGNRGGGRPGARGIGGGGRPTANLFAIQTECGVAVARKDDQCSLLDFLMALN